MLKCEQKLLILSFYEENTEISAECENIPMKIRSVQNSCSATWRLKVSSDISSDIITWKHEIILPNHHLLYPKK